jgi:hypothetical protein
MMTITGPCLQKLSQNVAKSLLKRMNQIMNSQFMNVVALNLFNDGFENRLLDDLTIEDNAGICDILFELSEIPIPDIGERAASLYSKVESKFN